MEVDFSKCHLCGVELPFRQAAGAWFCNETIGGHHSARLCKPCALAVFEAINENRESQQVLEAIRRLGKPKEIPSEW